MTGLGLRYQEAAPVAWRSEPPLGAWFPTQRRIATLVDLPDPEPAWKPKVEARLSKLQSYKGGWDGYAGKAPRPTVIAFVRSILESVMSPDTPEPSIVPFSGGGLQLEWHISGLDIELAVYAPFQAELSVEFHDGRDTIDELSLATDFSLLGSFLSELA